jgi:hypothetical protein
MISLSQYLTESKEGKNVHLEHIEDEPLNRGVEGTRDAINFLRSLRDMLAGNASGSTVNLTTKWDGCLDKSTQIITNEGIMTLGEVFDSWHSNRELMVLSYDEDTKTDCFSPILSAAATKTTKKWVRIDFGTCKIIATEDHEIMTTNRGWVPAGQLTSEDDVKTSESINIDGNHLYTGGMCFDIRLENKDSND